MTASRAVIYLILFAVLSTAALIVYLGVGVLQRLDRRRLVLLGIPIVLAYALLFVLRHQGWLPSSALVLLVSIFFGSLFGRGFSSRPSLIAFCITAAIVDILSFSFGPSDVIIESYERGDSSLLLYLTVSMPLRGQIVPIAGLGDFMILGILFAGLRQTGTKPLWALLIPLAGLLLAMAVGCWWVASMRSRSSPGW